MQDKKNGCGLPLHKDTILTTWELVKSYILNVYKLKNHCVPGASAIVLSQPTLVGNKYIKF